MESVQMSKENAVSKKSFPQGKVISSRLPSHAVGNLLEVHEFLCSFQGVLGFDNPRTFENLENELCSWSSGVGNSSGEMKSRRYLTDASTNVHCALLPRLVNQLLKTLYSAIKVKLEMLPINEFTWPEVVQRYIIAYLLMGGRIDSKENAVLNKTKLIHCLQYDGGIFSGSSTTVAGVDLDAQLLGRAIEKVSRKLKRERNRNIPEWAKVLDPVKKLPTNVGSRIRSCVYGALKKNPPEWAKKELEASISKEVYKGNASGPTKNAVINVLKRASDESQRASGAPQRPLPVKIDIRISELKSKVIMKKCRSILRHVADLDINKDFCNLVGRNFNSDVDEFKVVFGCAIRRPLDLRTIDLRLLHGAYGWSYEAFLEDVRELWINLNESHDSRLVRLADEMSKTFELKLKNEVATLVRRLSEYSMNGEVTEVEKKLEALVDSIEVPKAPWETGICKVCGVNRDDDMVLLCDTEGCNAEYHTYCLNPPLSDIPQGEWYCPTCNAPPNQPQGPRKFLQFEDKSWEEASQFVDIANALEETEYWELETDKKIFLVKFILDESLKTDLIRNIIDESPKKFKRKFLGIDSVGTLYWRFPDESSLRGIVIYGNISLEMTEINPRYHSVTRSQFEDRGTWCVFQSNEEIRNLADYLQRNDPEKIKLRNSIMKQAKSILRLGQQTSRELAEGEMVCPANMKKSSSNCLATKATSLLEAKYGLDKEPNAATSLMKRRRKNMARCYRCDCLEPILPSRFHCAECHETLFTNIEFDNHNCSTCSLSSSSEMSEVDSDKCHIFRQLKMNLLDMEAALPDEAKRPSRASGEWRSGWCEFVKSANTILEMVEATLVLETMIKTEYIKNTWWWYWSSVSVAAKTSTMCSLALRIYTLDAAINYNEPTTSPPFQEQTGERNRQQRKPRSKRKNQKGKQKTKAKEPQEKIGRMDMA